MEETATQGTNCPPCERFFPGWAWLAILLLFATVLHTCMIARTAVVARDTLGYVRYALLLEQLPLAQGLRKLEQHPLYPACVMALSWPIRHFEGTTPQSMILASQFVSALAGILLVIPMFYLGCEWFDRRSAFWGTALLQCLPSAAAVTADGISDSLYLLMLMTAMLFAVLAMRTRLARHFALAGIMSGLAYLTRPEGAFLAVAALLVLAGVQAMARTRWPWRRAFAGAAGLLVGAAVVAGPYMLLIGGITVKPGAMKILNNVSPADTIGARPNPEMHGQFAAHEPSLQSGPLLATSLLAIWWMDEKHGGPPPISWGFKAVVIEASHGFHYIAWLPALLGLWWYRNRFRQAGAWVMLVYGCIVVLLLVRVATGIHYLSERHALVLVACGSIWAGAGLVHMANWVPGWIAGLLRRPLAPRAATVLTTVVLAVSISWCLPVTLKPLHANRIGHREAGRWLAEHAEPTDIIADPYCWSRFYAGRMMDETHRIVGPEFDSSRFVVMTNSKNAHDRLFGMEKALELKRQGTVVFRWTPTPQQQRRYHSEEVEIYEVRSSAPETE
jgi:hypothetical protein